MKKLVVTTVIALAMLTGCDATETVKKVSLSDTDLLHHRYVLTSFNEAAIDTEPTKPLTLEFGEGLMISGVMCNNFSGKATLTNNVLMAPALRSTRMLCPQQQRNQLDGVIQQMFEKGATVLLSDNNKTLTLTAENNKLVYTLSDLIN